MIIRLDIGSGSGRYEDYTTVDQYVSADVMCLMWLLPYENDTVDAIWCSHALEHVSRVNAPKALKEFYRVLKPGSLATITVPDFDWIAKYWITNGGSDLRTSPERLLDPDWQEMIVFGNQVHEGEYHKSAWTLIRLKEALQLAGFSLYYLDWLWDHDQQSIKAIAVKPW
jgi:predicted SAM-dependent methyltransferase